MTDPVEEIQHRIFGDIKAAFNDTVADHALHPRHVGSLADADGFASVYSDCGECMEIWLQISENTIVDIAFWTDGCAATIACGSMVTELVNGKSPEAVMQMTYEAVVDGLNGLPAGNYHCAELAIGAVQTAVSDYRALQRDPWKKAYRQR